ncbi:MAG: anhydro-N-acetylmuramic acid kinase [Citrobacter freundii]|nr:MAG: anhydro-N-acetylmuramic acid kinase [Citrobacter freundii]
MIYRAIGLMSGSSLDGLDIVFTELHENGGKWSYEILASACYPYSEDWTKRLSEATSLSAKDYLLLHTAYGEYIGQQVNRFIEENSLQFKVALVASHGHTTFHIPAKNMTAQLGDGAAIAAVVQLPVVTDLRSLDVAFGGQGAPIVPIGEKLLLQGYDYFLNLGGIANISMNTAKYTAFDICAANRVLNMLAQKAGKEYDEDGKLAASGKLDQALLDELNTLDYYNEPFPKSLANDFGTDIVFPIVEKAGLSVPDALHTYAEHIAVQIRHAITALPNHEAPQSKLLATGGGALNLYLIERIREQLNGLGIEVVVPSKELIQYKEALIMALIGVLRWREENNVLSSVTGAKRDSVGGAMWMGQEY